jgi:hypothetical protein
MPDLTHLDTLRDCLAHVVKIPPALTSTHWHVVPHSTTDEQGWHCRCSLQWPACSGLLLRHAEQYQSLLSDACCSAGNHSMTRHTYPALHDGQSTYRPPVVVYPEAVPCGISHPHVLLLGHRHPILRDHNLRRVVPAGKQDTYTCIIHVVGVRGALCPAQLGQVLNWVLTTTSWPAT